MFRTTIPPGGRYTGVAVGAHWSVVIVVGLISALLASAVLPSACRATRRAGTGSPPPSPRFVSSRPSWRMSWRTPRSGRSGNQSAPLRGRPGRGVPGRRLARSRCRAGLVDGRAVPRSACRASLPPGGPGGGVLRRRTYRRDQPERPGSDDTTGPARHPHLRCLPYLPAADRRR